MPEAEGDEELLWLEELAPTSGEGLFSKREKWAWLEVIIRLFVVINASLEV